MNAERMFNALFLSNPRQISVIKYREKLARQLLGERYDGVYDFFCDVLDDGSTYKILRARRCQVLFELFLQIILLNKDVEDIKGTFLSSNALEYRMDALRDKSESVLIVDDVLIHGRGMKQLYEQIDSNYSRDSVHIMVYCRALSATYIDAKLEERFCNNYLPVFDYEWRNVSCCFVDLIISSVIPYESFAGSLEKCAQFNFSEFEQSFTKLENTTSDYSSSYVLFEKKPIPIFFNSIGYDVCLRVYTSKEFELTTYVPYVFTASISSASALQLFAFMSKHLDRNRFAHILEILMMEDDGLRAYQMRLFSALVNRIYGVHLQREYNILDGAQPNRVNMYLCFGHEIANELIGICYEDISALLNEYPPYNIVTVSEDKMLSTFLHIYNPDNITMYRSLSMYYFINGQYDEECAKKKAVRTLGLSIGSFYGKIDPSRCHEMTVAQLRCWDYGQASGVMKADKNGTISLFGIAGEQHFRFILQENKGFFKKQLADYSLSVLRPHKEDVAINAEETSTNNPETRQKLSEEEKLFQAKNQELLDAFLLNNSDCLVEWFIPQVLS